MRGLAVQLPEVVCRQEWQRRRRWKVPHRCFRDAFESVVLAGWAGRDDEVLAVVVLDVLVHLLTKRLAVLVQGEGRRSQPLLRSYVVPPRLRARRRRLGCGLAIVVVNGQGGGVPPRLHFHVLRRRVDNGTVRRDRDAVVPVEVQAVVGAAPLVGVGLRRVGGVGEGGAEGVDVGVRHRDGGG